MGLDAIEGLAGALDTTATQCYALAREVDDWARLHATDARARTLAAVLAGDLGGAAAMLRAAVDQAQALERHLAADG